MLSGPNELKEIKHIHNERMKRESETDMKKLLVHSHTIRRTKSYSVPQPRDVNVEVIQELVLIWYLKEFGLGHYRDLSH